jgi:phosphohistidine phosphatase
MKTLFLIRHAKSDWSIDGLADIDRPLNARGYNDAHKMSLLMCENKIKPDLIISSPAIRAISTALIFSRILNYNPSKIVMESQLYETSANTYSDVVSKISQTHQCVMLFGHNPIISDFASLLSPKFKNEMSTCGIVAIQKQVKNWNEFITTKSDTVYYDFPKNHL